MAPLSIAVIGAGPSGLFFCHAIEHMMKQTGKLVEVTCFERSSQAGGIWKAAEPKASGAETTEMYDKLWTNGASHLTEFFDYTYDEHFGGPVSVYMKRQDLLDYILGRVKKNCPNFLEKYVAFRKEVVHVVYDDAKQQFNITVKDMETSQTEVGHFDKCVWACGENGKRNMPENLVQMFRDGGFQGRVIHSSDTARLEEDVRGKRILLVGGGYSAEDLALQAIKLGVQKVYVSTRDDASEICWTKCWPMNKVKLLWQQAPFDVTENGRCVQFHEVNWTPYGYEKDEEGDEVETELRDIHTVILCTGYHPNLDMLDPSLRQGFPKDGCRVEENLQIPEDWKMAPNLLSEYTGEVAVCDHVRYYAGHIHPNFYRGVLISNPNMMFITTYDSHVPLMACDAYAWLLAGYSTGWVDMPTAEEMRELNQSEALALLNLPYYRYHMDDNYWKKIDSLEDFWPEEPTGDSPVWEEVEYEEYTQSVKMLARVMQEGKYPFSIGTYEKLNKKGEAIIHLGELDYCHRANLKRVGDEKKWKTFRDVDNSEMFYSLFTGTKAIPLAQRWMEA